MDDNIKNIVDIILKRVTPLRIYLFGYRSRTDFHSDSDYNICILVKDKINRNHLTMKLYKDFSGFNKSIDIIIEYDDEFNNNIDNKYMIYKDISTGKLIYA